MGIATFANDSNTEQHYNQSGESVVGTRTTILNCSSNKNSVRVVSTQVAESDDFETAVDFSEFIEDEFGESQADITDNDMSVCVLALPFSETYDFGSGTIQFDRHAFDETLAEINDGDHYFYLAADGHTLDALYLLARSDVESGPGSVKAKVNDTGLWLIGKFVDTQVGRDTYELISRGVLTKASVGISINEEFDEDGAPINYDLSHDDNGKSHYTYKKIGLNETSFVARPAFSDTEVKPLNINEEKLGEAEAETDMAEANDTADIDINDFAMATKFMLSELSQITKDNAALSAENDQLRSQIIDKASDIAEPSEDVKPLADIAKDMQTNTDNKMEVISRANALQHFVTQRRDSNG